VLALPIPAHNYVGLKAGKAGTLFLAEVPANLLTIPPPQPGQPLGILTVTKFDLATRKTSPVVSNVAAFDVSFNGEKMLHRQGDKWFIANAGGPGGTGGAGAMAALAARNASGGGDAGGSGGPQTLKTDDMEVRVDPRAEWRQMYREVWRLQRDFLYDPGFHG